MAATADSSGRLGDRLSAALLDSAPDAFVVVNEAGEIALVNAQTEKLLGYERTELLGQPVEMLVPNGLESMHRRHREGFNRDPRARPMGGEAELRVRRKDGSHLPVEISLVPLPTDDGILVSAVIRDATDRRRSELQLRYLADHDPLTGLLNRRRFEDELRREIARAARGEDAVLLIIDIDNFKYVNEAFGHSAGDDLIREVADVIGERLRETDSLARLGGDEFAAILPLTGLEPARTLAEDLCRIVRERPIMIHGRRAQTTVSIGIAQLDREIDGDRTLANADLAMYSAKERGRDRVALFSEEGRGAIAARFNWGERIRAALEDDLFVPYFQPILSLGSKRITQWELLIRMGDGSGGLIPPSSFLPTAERLGLTRALDLRIVEHAIDAIVEHGDRADVCLEVNLSGRSVDDLTLLGEITERIRAAGIDPERLIFEVTETAAISSIDDARRFGEGLRELGCGFALDDFGKGFASFYYLKHLPVTHIKIDGDFVSKIRTSPTDRLVVQAMVQIARGLGLQTIAEYVEDPDTVELLASYGIDYCQGFGIGRPGPPVPPDLVPRIEPWLEPE